MLEVDLVAPSRKFIEMDCASSLASIHEYDEGLQPVMIHS